MYEIFFFKCTVQTGHNAFKLSCTPPNKYPQSRNLICIQPGPKCASMWQLNGGGYGRLLKWNSYRVRQYRRWWWAGFFLFWSAPTCCRISKEARGWVLMCANKSISPHPTHTHTYTPTHTSCAVNMLKLTVKKPGAEMPNKLVQEGEGAESTWSLLPS